MVAKKDALAERLLAHVMGWISTDVAREWPRLQAIAAYKYDEYQLYAPGMRFVESLALWLNQFASDAHKRIAYEFIVSRLVFCSSGEMNHPVSVSYPDHIRPLLLQATAADLALEPWRVSRIGASVAFRVRQRRCLFVGLSDGARIDQFRRANQEYLPTKRSTKQTKLPSTAATACSRSCGPIPAPVPARRTVGRGHLPHGRGSRRLLCQRDELPAADWGRRLRR